MKRLFTSESVTEGHPDKVCDRVSDSILDAILEQDPDARVACECAATTQFLLIMGEITTTAKIDIDGVARDAIRNIGYTDERLGFDADHVEIKILLNKQSPDIKQGVDDSIEHKTGKDDYDKTGAGDQGMMFGYANSETESYMPLAVVLSHRLCKRLTEVRKERLVPYLRPDGKAQVTVEYDETGKPYRIDTVVLSTQHDESVEIETLRADMRRLVIQHEIAADLLDENTNYHINPTGRFVTGGPMGDSGLTGRKLVVDTYGGYVPHGGGAFSGKDATKVDRSACYYARYVAKNLVASGICKELRLQVAYAIGKARPVSIDVDTAGTGIVSDEKILEIVKKLFDFRPKAIIDNLRLNRPQYAMTTAYGHFGREEFVWERTDKVQAIQESLRG